MTTNQRTLGRMNTSMERVFRATKEGYFREIWLHFINFMNEDGTLKSSKLDKTIPGKLWKIARADERSMYGECMYKFPENPAPVRLVCLGKDW